MSLVFLSLGSNKGSRLRAIARANSEISDNIGTIVAFSSIYETEPWGFQADKNFLNQVIEIETELEPDVLMTELLKLESMMGRKRSVDYQSREIDIDILLYADRVVQNDNLQIPHPRMHLRKFVLEPLVEIAPVFVHPVFGNTTTEILEQCQDTTHIALRYEKGLIPSLFEESLNSYE
jgi:2-amino-4-hydroxy-6-hydroxymethyldihydropteridine diphosphokinase